MSNEQRPALAQSIYAALFTGLITVGAYIAVPLPVSPVPIVLQNFFVLLAGLLLPLRWAVASVALYLGLGAVGLPVFSAARGGLAHFVGPTGGYLVGFLPAVAVCALIAAPDRAAGAGSASRPVRDTVATVAATAIIYALGTPWLAQVMDLAPGAAVGAGILPFLPGDALKIAAAVAVAQVARPLLRPGAGVSGKGAQ
ncbi:MAG: biotin transporter BioY [Spirochaetes bacterium]|nr:biotin transporter BioY [Spirochaetota bacterium]